MTIETKPATDEEIERYREAAARNQTDFTNKAMRRVIARTDAERERADKAEHHVRLILDTELTGQLLLNQEKQIAALREALKAVYPWIETSPEGEAATARVRQALAQTEGAEG